MNRKLGLALAQGLLGLLGMFGLVACRQPLARPTCRPMQVTSDGLRADWFYLDRSEHPRSIAVYDSGGQLLAQTRFHYENNRLVLRETQSAGGQPLERVRFGYDEAGRVSLRERWPQRSGNFDESYFRERRSYRADGRLSARLWQIDRSEINLTARTEHLDYDSNGQLVASRLFRDDRDDPQNLIYHYEYTPSSIANTLGAFWIDEPTWSLADRLPSQVTARFRDGRIDSTASFELIYQLNSDGLPVEVDKKALRGSAQRWYIRYSCR